MTSVRQAPVPAPRPSGEALLHVRDADVSLGLLIKAVEEYAIFSLDAGGAVRTWNVGAHRIKGYAEQEILGRHFSVFYLPEDQQAGLPQAALAHATHHGDWCGEGWRVRRDGTTFWADVVITAVFGPDGELTGFVKLTRDATERRSAEANQHRLELLRERERIALELTDATTRSIFAATLTLARALATSNDPRVTEFVEEAISALDRTVTQIRSTVTSLRS